MVSIERSENLVLPENILTHVAIFSCFYFKKHVLAVSYLTITLGMMNDNPRSSPVIIAYFPIDQAGGRDCLVAESLQK